MTTKYKEGLFKYLGSFPNSRAEELGWSWFQMAGMDSRDQYCEGLDLEA